MKVTDKSPPGQIWVSLSKLFRQKPKPSTNNSKISITFSNFPDCYHLIVLRENIRGAELNLNLDKKIRPAAAERG